MKTKYYVIAQYLRPGNMIAKVEKEFKIIESKPVDDLSTIRKQVEDDLFDRFDVLVYMNVCVLTKETLADYFIENLFGEKAN